MQMSLLGQTTTCKTPSLATAGSCCAFSTHAPGQWPQRNGFSLSILSTPRLLLLVVLFTHRLLLGEVVLLPGLDEQPALKGAHGRKRPAAPAPAGRAAVAQS